MNRPSHFTPDEKRRLVSSVESWWHSIDLGDGVVTPGSIPAETYGIKGAAIPADLRGKTVLDIGTCDGYYAFECERRGARVTAIDSNEYPDHDAGFRVAHRVLGSDVDYRELDLYDLPSVFDEPFDVVLMLGVLYHLRHPLRALEIVRTLTRETLVLETHYVRTVEPDPVMRFYPGDELGGDPTNWWGPNAACVRAMVHVAGFRTIVDETTYFDVDDRGRLLLTANA